DVDATTWILDPVARAIVGWPGARETENSNTAVAEFLDTLDQLKFEGGVEDLFLAHHTGRAAQTPGAEHGRGATRWDDWPDVRKDAAITYANEQGMIDLVPSGKSLLINLRRDHPDVADRIVV